MKSIIPIVLIATLAITMFSGCIEETPMFMISGDDKTSVGIYEKYTIEDLSGKPGNVSFDIDWGNGMKCHIKKMPVEATTCVKNVWMWKGNYDMIVTGHYDNGVNYTVTKLIEVN